MKPPSLFSAANGKRKISREEDGMDMWREDDDESGMEFEKEMEPDLVGLAAGELPISAFVLCAFFECLARVSYSSLHVYATCPARIFTLEYSR